MDPTNRPMRIELDGMPVDLLFDLNTFSQFERASGKVFLDWLNTVQEAIKNAGATEDPMAMLRVVSMQDLHALLYAAYHKYDERDEPYWPMTMGRIGRHVTMANFMQLINAVVKGNADNMPEAKEEEVRPTERLAKPAHVNGGVPFGPSGGSILDSRIERLGD